MTVSIKAQLLIFAFSLLAGLGTGFLLDWFRIIRNTFSKKITMVGDAAFFIIAAFFLFWALLFINDGAFRWYEWSGILFGVGCYKIFLSRFVIRCSEKIIWLLSKVLHFLIKILLFPAILLHRILKKPMITVIHPAKVMGKSISRSFKSFRKERKRKREISKKIWKKI